MMASDWETRDGQKLKVNRQRKAYVQKLERFYSDVTSWNYKSSVSPITTSLNRRIREIGS
ncbi:hypothetical protein PSCICF_21080 [Pseudomonas cichorii]|nr:hypothetical protein PSCICF_21080 [Pseudomonas cichorii]